MTSRHSLASVQDLSSTYPCSVVGDVLEERRKASFSEGVRARGLLSDPSPPLPQPHPKPSSINEAWDGRCASVAPHCNHSRPTRNARGDGPTRLTRSHRGTHDHEDASGSCSHDAGELIVDIDLSPRSEANWFPSESEQVAKPRKFAGPTSGQTSMQDATDKAHHRTAPIAA